MQYTPTPWNPWSPCGGPGRFCPWALCMADRHGRLRSAVSLWLTDAYPVQKRSSTSASLWFFAAIRLIHTLTSTRRVIPPSLSLSIYLYLHCLESRDRSQTRFVVGPQNAEAEPDDEFNGSPPLQKKNPGSGRAPLGAISHMLSF